MQNIVIIGNRSVGDGRPIFIIAEAGVNHNGNLEIAKQLIDVATEAGADAVKFQTFTAELLATDTAPQAEYQAKNTGKIESQLEMLKKLELPRAWHVQLQQYAKEKGIIFLSTPFSEDDADFLESIHVPAYKIPSGEITNIPYLKHIAKFSKPMIVSTGMASLAEVKDAVAAIQEEGNEQVVVLHSTSNYPPSLGSLNLKAITTLQKELHLPIGYSDNGSPGVAADEVAAGLGACVIEKHFTLDKNMEGPDHRASLDPVELKAMVQAIRDTEVMLGSFEKKCTPEEVAIRAIARKSIISKKPILAGSIIKLDDLVMKRPGYGVPPTKIDNVVGKKASRDIPADVVIDLKDLV
ncbi:MAG: N-acetylneuraminate synthase [Candidatus Magasanikbacteria bacterium]|nr:N-acetylneuraminate synthase [Candidatus Magasanikbacteria bacterium]